jgi:hypothetical protein
VKINKAALTVEVDQSLEDVTVKQIAEELPESAPRFFAKLIYCSLIVVDT